MSFAAIAAPVLAAGASTVIGKMMDKGQSRPDIYQQNRLSPAQERLQNQSVKAGMGSGAGGAFGDAADYYRGLLGNNQYDFDQMAAPEMRRFNEQIVPDLSEQFAGMGSGNLSSSGFRNAAVSAGADLSERLGAIRAQLRSQGAQGLQNIGQIGLQPTYENLYNQPQATGTENFMEGLGKSLPSMAQGAADYFNKPKIGGGQAMNPFQTALDPAVMSIGRRA